MQWNNIRKLMKPSEKLYSEMIELLYLQFFLSEWRMIMYNVSLYNRTL